MLRIKLKFVTIVFSLCIITAQPLMAKVPLTKQELIIVDNFWNNLPTLLDSNSRAKNDTEVMNSYKEKFIEIHSIVKDAYISEIDSAKLQELLNNTYTEIKNNLPELLKARNKPLNADLLSNLAIKRFVSSLDPHSAYMTPDETKQFKDMISGNYFGIGISTSYKKDAGLLVESVVKSAPAYLAGIRKGDIITSIDNIAIKDEDYNLAIKKLKDKSKKDIPITLVRENKTMQFSITPSYVDFDAVTSYTIDNSILYIYIPSFQQQMSSQVRKILKETNLKNIKGIILDLRDNPGGVLEQANTILNSILPENRISVQIRGKNPDNATIYKTLGNYILPQDIPMVTLINDLSASASEVVSAALQENNRSKVMGVNSFGKGSVQMIYRLSDEASLRLTTQLYYTSQNYSVQGIGVKPDIFVKPIGYKKVKKEQDYNNMLPAPNLSPREPIISINESICPVEKNSNDDSNDYLLGCAILYLKSGNIEAFQNSISSIAKNNSTDIELDESIIEGAN